MFFASSFSLLCHCVIHSLSQSMNWFSKLPSFSVSGSEFVGFFPVQIWIEKENRPSNIKCNKVFHSVAFSSDWTLIVGKLRNEAPVKISIFNGHTYLVLFWVSDFEINWSTHKIGKEIRPFVSYQMTYQSGKSWKNHLCLGTVQYPAMTDVDSL